jgi:hypothetical protein
MSSNEEIVALNKLIADRDELDKVVTLSGGFNIFRVLRNGETEIRHSNVLAWLLDPQGDHGLGDTFLREFVLSAVESTDQHSISVSEAYLLDFDDVRILREFHNIDILIESESKKLIVVIENKIRSTDGNNQLEKYRTFINEEYSSEKKYRKLFVYLTLDGTEPGQDSEYWTLISYKYHILHVLRKILDSGVLSEERRMFIDHYSKTLQDLTMENEELVKLCRDLYARHRFAIDKIYEYAMAVDYSELIDKLKDPKMRCGQRVPKGKMLFLVPDQISEAFRGLESDGWTADNWAVQSPIAFWFKWEEKESLNDEKNGNTMTLLFSIELGPIADQDRRGRLLGALHSKGFASAGNARGSKFTRIVSKSRTRLESNDPDQIAKVGIQIYTDAVDAYLQKIVGAIESLKLNK